VHAQAVVEKKKAGLLLLGSNYGQTLEGDAGDAEELQC
jgi:hypothetical protein